LVPALGILLSFRGCVENYLWYHELVFLSQIHIKIMVYKKKVIVIVSKTLRRHNFDKTMIVETAMFVVSKYYPIALEKQSFH
jgi:hypothetical protein